MRNAVICGPCGLRSGGSAASYVTFPRTYGPYPLRWTPGLAARFVGRARNVFDTPVVLRREYKAQSIAFGR
jgi:hypothetical protein